MTPADIAAGRWECIVNGPGPAATVRVFESLTDRRIARFETHPHDGGPSRVEFRVVGIDRDFPTVGAACAAINESAVQ